MRSSTFVVVEFSDINFIWFAKILTISFVIEEILKPGTAYIYRSHFAEKILRDSSIKLHSILIAQK